MTNAMVSKKAWDIWNQICYAWFDWGCVMAGYVTNKAYNTHLEIEHILMNGETWNVEPVAQ